MDMNNLLVRLNELENSISCLEKNILKDKLGELFCYLEQLELSLDDKRKIYDRLKELSLKLKEDNNPVLLDIKLNLEAFLIAYFYEFRDYQGDKYKLMEYILFELKNYDIVVDIINKYPLMINLKDESGKFIIANIIDKYLEELDNYTKNYEIKKINSLGYYEQVISLFINRDNLELEESKKNDFINKINSLKQTINNAIYNDITKRKYFFWLNNLIDILNKNEDNHLDNLFYKYDVSPCFDLSILKEISYLKPKEMEKLEEKCIIAIDGVGAKEIDDSICSYLLPNGNYKLEVYITDPSYYIDKSSIILDEAMNRGTSVYLSDLTISLFPDVLAKDKMSLLANQKRAVLKFEVEVNQNGDIEDFRIDKSYIALTRNITYGEVNDILEHGCADKELEKTINLLRDVTYKLRKQFQMSDVYSILNRTKPNITDTNVIEQTNSSMIVETSMLIVNYLLAKYMNEHHFPFIYRNHVVNNDTKDEIKKLMLRINEPESGDVKKIYNYLNSIYPKAYYDTICLGHNGIGIPKYTHITSPLRREADLINIYYSLNQFVFDNIEDKQAYLIEEFLKERSNYINEKNIMMNNFRKVYERKYK